MIRIVSPGPIFFRQQRIGFQGRPFTMWKFRTMKADVSCRRHREYVEKLAATDGVLSKLSTECQLIPSGGVLRKLAIDEVPQLINVLRGEMSLVGPRPDVLPCDAYQDAHRRRFDVVPGMTGLWQVAGGNGATFTKMIQLDLEYVERRSFWLDAKILLGTVPAVVRRLGKNRIH